MGDVKLFAAGLTFMYRQSSLGVAANTNAFEFYGQGSLNQVASYGD